MSKIARRQFMQLSAVAAAGLVVSPGREAKAQDMPQIEESDPVAQSLKYTHDASSVDPASRANPAPEQDCSNCALIQGDEGAGMASLPDFPGQAGQEHRLVFGLGAESLMIANPARFRAGFSIRANRLVRILTRSR